MKANIPVALSLMLLTTACKPQQAPISSADDETLRKLAGAWAGEFNYASGSHVDVLTTVAPSGGYVSRLSMPGRTQGPRLIEQQGTWRVEHGFIIETVTSDSQTNAPVPYTNRMRLVRVDDRELALEVEKIPGAVYPANQTIFRKRTNL